MKIIIKNGESVEIYHNAGDVVVLPKSKLVRRFNEYGSLIEEYSLVDKKITLDDDLENDQTEICLLYTSPSPRDATLSRMPSSA